MDLSYFFISVLKIYKKSSKVFAFIFLAAIVCGCQTSKSKTTAIKVEVSTWKPVNTNLIGANANLISFDAPWNNEDLLEVTNKTKIKTLRYPGGTIGNYWDWDIGAIDRNVADSLMIKWVVANDLTKSPERYTLENLAELYNKTGIVPVFMLNMLSKDLEHSLRNLRKAKSLGIPIKFIEMGNELYFNIPFPLLKYPTPEIYGETCQLWITVLKDEFPEASFAVVGSYMERHPRQVNWNQRVLSQCTNADAITIHFYSPSGLDGRLERKRIKPGKEGLGSKQTAIRKGPKDLRERQLWETELLQDKNAYANMFTTAHLNLKKLNKLFKPEDMQLWVTEFNIRDDNSVVLHSWAQSLILAEYYFEFLENDVTLSHLHNLIGKLFGMIHTDTLSYDHLKSQNVQSVPYSLSAGGLTTKIFGEAMSGMQEMAPLDFKNVPSLIDDRDQQFDVLKGYVFKNGKQKTAIVVNYDFEKHEIQFNGNPEEYTTLYSYSSRPSNPVNGIKNVVLDTVTLSKEIVLPKHSISIIQF
ncbi:hypothetical protein B0O79_3343 [Flavobacteriaceae bacterium MAR_2009_75]|nr:hypothetical protein B0O79_3343 [Flavobacteriaceae bacterium MAR_2009_75]